MAKRIIHELVDDIDGSTAEETIRFALEGVEYQIDLSKKNANRFWSTFQSYVEAGTKIGRVQSRPAPYQRQVPGGRASAGDRERNREIRDWAVASGFAINDRGRIRAEIVQFWENRAKLDQTALREALMQFGTDEVKASFSAPAPAAVPAQKAAPKSESTNGSKPDVAAAVAASKPPAAAKKTAAAKKAVAAAK